MAVPDDEGALADLDSTIELIQFDPPMKQPLPTYITRMINNRSLGSEQRTQNDSEEKEPMSEEESSEPTNPSEELCKKLFVRHSNLFLAATS